MSFLGMLDKTKQDSKNCKKAINNHLKKISQYFILRFLVIAFLFSTINFSFTVVNAQSTEMENRETVYYPSDETGTSMSEFMNVPNTPEQNASMSGNTLTLTTGIANGGYAKSQTQINLAEQDYVWVFNYQAPSNGVSIAARDGGVAFTLHNDPGFVSEEDGDYGALGIYRLLDKNKNVNNEGIKNAVTVEFDNCNYSQPYVASYVWKQNFDAALKYGDYRPHIAITNPQGISPTNDEIPHEALSLLTSPIWNNSNNTIRISWSLTDAGNSNDKTDNIYTLKYEYYQGSSTVTANPTATGTKTFTYNEMIERFGGEMVYFSLSGSTGVVARTQTISAIQTYPYEVNYYVQLADGTKTLNKVPGISPNPKTGKLPAGINNIGPLPNVAKYVVVPGQNTNVNITSSATADVFNYYYIDDAPVINGADDKEIFIGESFDPLAGVTANDDEDGSITLTAGNVIGSVNTQQADSYTLTYTVIDSAGNKTIVYRNITVKNRKLILHSGSSNTTHTQIVNNPTAINLDSIDTSSTGAFYLDGSDFWGWTITEGNTTPDYLNESSNISTDKYLYNGTLNVPVEKLGTPDANGDYHLYAVYAPKITVTVKKTWEGSARPDSIWVALFVRTSLYAEEVSPWTGVATYYYVENSTQQITDYDSTITWDNLPYVDSNGLRLTYIVTEGTTEELAKKGGGSFEVEIFTTTINGVSREVRADKLVNGSDVYVLQTLAEQQKNASGITTGYDFPIYKNILVKIDAPNIATVFEQETSLKINLPAEGSNTLKKVDIWLENPGTNAPAGPADLTINKINGGWQMSTAGYTLTGPDADGSYTISGFAPFVKDQEIFAKTFGEDSLSNAIESALEHKTVLALVYTEKPANETAYAKIEFLSGANGSFAQGDITTYWVKKGTSWGTFISAVVTLPGINANSGYTFNGWDASGIPQTGEIINDGRTFTASYTKKEMILETNPNDSDYVYISYHSADATDHNNVYGKIKKGVDGALVDTITYYVLKGTTRQDILNAMNESPPKYYIPTIVPNTGYSTVGSESGASGWNILLSDATIINENLDLYVLYFKLDDVIADNTPNEESEKPAGYITITFLAGDNGSLTGVTKYYVNPDAGKTYGDIAEPSIVPNSGYAIAPNPWNPICLKETAITTDATYIAQYLEKTLPPVITRPVANDTTVSGTAPAGSEVIVDFGNGKTVTIEATDGKWTVDVPDGVVLIEE